VDENPNPALPLVAEGPAPVPLLDRQRELLGALTEKDQRLADMYVGCLAVLRDGANPDAIHLAAHAARELMRYVPEVLDLPWKAHGEKLGDKVQALYGQWTSAAAKSTCRKVGPVWDGQIDAPLKKLLSAIDAFFSWKETHMPRRRVEAMKLLAALEASAELPQHVQEVNAAAWEALAGYFNGLAHHGAVVERAEFDRHLFQLEEFLLVRLRPRTFEDFGAIDALLAESGTS
jgi:hypothetical protein